eukprot:TRINITY_DN30048_c0_g1_i1.p1 TRINITY_DN30048_c0_g1~~TRINITY_DN30048_c0_g1_i1.p1  ORF type:complete len:351 (+),score=52.62 TRINITY_DN30048_c0_g1_i1:33-1055(+)
MADPSYVPMLSSALAGGIARIFIHPLDTVKARLQVQTRSAGAGNVNDSAIFRHTADALRRTVAAEGVGGLYRGFSITFMGSMPAVCLYLTTYEAASSTLADVLPRTGITDFGTYFISGFVAETVSCALFVPIDVVKERLQIQNPALGNVHYNGSFDAVRTMLRQEGPGGFYRGYGSTLLSFGPYSALYFLFYEECKKFATRRLGTSSEKSQQKLPTFAVLASSATAGAFASILTNPLDLVKLRIQVQRGQQATASPTSQASFSSAASVRSVGALHWPEYRNMAHGLRLLIQHEGLPGAFRGVGARIAFSIPSTAITFSLFEELKPIVRRAAGLPISCAAA